MGKKIGNEELKLDIVINGNKAQKELIKYDERNREISSTLKELRTEKEKLAKAGKTESDAYKKVTTTISGLNKEMKTNKSEMDKLQKEIGITGLTVGQLDKKAKALKTSMKHMIPGSPERKKAENELGAIRDRIGEIDGKANKNKKTMLSSVTDIAAGIGVAAIATKILEWGTAFVKSSMEMRKFKQDVKLMTGEVGDQLNTTTGQIQTIVDMYGKDFSLVLKSANTLAKEMGITTSEALKLIENGFIAGADVNGDFLDKVKEYPAQFAAAGLSAEAFVAIATQEVKMGIYDDKGVDAIKEGMLSLREMTKASSDAIKGIGLDSDKIQKDIADGTMTSFEALQKISGKMAEMPPQSKEVGTAIADIFKGAGEDAGIKFLSSLQDISLEMDGLIDLEDPYVQSQMREAEATNALNKAMAEATSVGGFFNNMLVASKEAAADAMGAINALSKSNVSGWTKLKATFGNISAIVEVATNVAKMQADEQAKADALFLDNLLKKAQSLKIYTDEYKNLTNEEIQALITAEEKRIRLEKDKEARDLLALERKKAKEQLAIKADAKAQKRQEEKDTKEAQRLAAKFQKEIEDEIKRIDKLNEVYKNKTGEINQQNELEAEALRLQKEALEITNTEERAIKLAENAKYIADMQLQIELEKELASIEGVENAEALKQAIKTKYALKQGKLDSDYTAAFSKHKKEEVKWADMSEKEKIGVAVDGLNAVSENVTKGTAAWKAAEIGKAGIQTYQNATAAYGAMAAIPVVGPALGVVAAGAAVYAGMQNVRKIMSTKIPEQPKFSGYQEGLYPMTRTDGKTFDVKYGGSPTTQIVDKPTHFIAGEVQPEMIIDGATFKRLDPAVIQAIQMARFPGYADGLYPTKTNQTFSADTETSTNVDELSQGLALQELVQIRQLLSKGVIAYYDDDEVRNIKELIEENELVKQNATK